MLFYGTPEFAVPALAALVDHPELFAVKAVVTQPDRPAGRGGKLRASPVKELALTHAIPVLQPGSIKKELEQFTAALSSFGPLDAAVVAAFGQILPVAALNIPRAGSINIHGSLLPRWRGAAPIHRAILHGDAETGVALMRMEAGLDTGAVYSEARIRIGPSDTTGRLLQSLAKLGATILVRDLPGIISGAITATPQAPEGVTIASKITNEEAEIAWELPALEIDRRIRAFNPFPGAFTYLQGQRVKLFTATPKPEVRCAGKQPGEVTLLDPRSLEVATGAGVLAIEEAQIEGRKRLPIEEFLRGAPLAKDARFGR
ncbi:MAG: methionyl-tRNA formyltransferase [Proteobacteria bacterium]|nr:methionyl-tRNA formyltransferase [Pseudomonadota bacterium]